MTGCCSILFISEADEIEVEALEGVPRYATIVGKQIRHILDRAPDATGVNLVCHSMGCLVSRYLMENDVEGLASEGLYVRWVTYAGVVRGADLAHAFADLDAAAELIGLDLIDVQHMTYDWLSENVATCDGEREYGNNPVYEGMLIHHLLADDPYLAEKWGLPLLDFNNPDSLPNDAIVWTDDQWFADMDDAARLTTPGGDALRSTRSYHNVDHFIINEIDGAHALSVATLVGSRRVEVRLESLTLLNDREWPGTTGARRGSPRRTSPWRPRCAGTGWRIAATTASSASARWPTG